MRSLRDIIANAKHYLAVGQQEIYLSSDGKEFPWEFATHCEPGGSHRLDIHTDVWFYADHPCGLKFRWSFDIEPQSANGKGSYEIDSAGCRRVLSMLPRAAQASFKAYLADCSKAVREKAEQWQAITTRQFHDAETLRQLASE